MDFNFKKIPHILSILFHLPISKKSTISRPIASLLFVDSFVNQFLLKKTPKQKCYLGVHQSIQFFILYYTDNIHYATNHLYFSTLYKGINGNKIGTVFTYF